MKSIHREAEYYYANGEKVPLFVEPDVFAVRYKHQERDALSEISSESRRYVRDESEKVASIEEYGLEVYHATDVAASDAEESIERMVEELDEEEEIEFAIRAFRQSPENDELTFVTNRFSVQFKPDVSEPEIAEFNRHHDVRVLEELDYAENGYVLEAPEGDGERGAIELANVYFESGLVEFATPDLVRRVEFKSTPVHVSGRSQAVDPEGAGSIADAPPYLGEQWHLRTAAVTDAWAVTRGSSSVSIAIIDDGIEVDHPEFQGLVSAQYDFEFRVADGNPKRVRDSHGTACAGVALANGDRASGVAPECSLIAIRTPLSSAFLGSIREARMFSWAAHEGADVISCSWGPADNAGPFPLADNVRAALRYCVTRGRDGNGIPVFFAAGNGDEPVSDDGYATSEHTIAVAASTDDEEKAPYSDFGPEIWICAPSSGGERAVLTADRRGSLGYNPRRGGPVDDQDYTDTFGGTSSATPLVAGLAGLMFSVNSDLTVEDVKGILRDTADKIGEPSDYDENGHSHVYGYGRVNALRAVEAAKEKSETR